jgi:hypothetical protein
VKDPKVDNWLENGMFITGGEFLETTRVAFKVTEPVVSVAVSWILTGATVFGPASLTEGVPDRSRRLLSRDSQLGPAERVYVSGRVEENVELEKVYENCSDTRATGGTWELIGKVIVGIASMRVPKMAAANRTNRIAILKYRIKKRWVCEEEWIQSVVFEGKKKGHNMVQDVFEGNSRQ